MKQKTFKNLATFLFLTLFAVTSIYSFAGEKPSRFQFKLEMGPYTAGFKVVNQYDYSRTFYAGFDLEGKATKENARPIHTNIWYPADKEKSKDLPKMVFKEYLFLTAYELDFTPRSQEELEKNMESFLYEWDAQKDRFNELNAPTNAVKNATPAKGNFPLIIYAPSLNSVSYENDALCEYLASNGYIVVSSPSFDRHTRYIETTVECCENQAQDMQFLLQSMQNFPNVNLDQIAVMGFSWGGMSNVLMAMWDSRVKAVISLDCSLKNPNHILHKARYYNPDNITMPTLFASSKIVPDHLWKKYGMEPPKSQRIKFFDDLKYPTKYFIRFNETTHYDFASTMIRLLESDPDLRSPIDKINQSHNAMCQYVHMFLNAHLKNDPNALAFMNKKPTENGYPEELITMDSKKGKTPPPSAGEFFHNAKKKGLANISTYFAELKKIYPDFSVDNNSLLFFAAKLQGNKQYDDAIAAFRFNTEIFPKDMYGFYGLGDSYKLKGDLENALKAYQNADKIRPGYPPSTKRLNEIKELIKKKK